MPMMPNLASLVDAGRIEEEDVKDYLQPILDVL